MSATASHRASHPHRSAWVSAHAGTGKTHLLANRVTRLLLAGADPARILCLTYTKAAAAEMTARLYERLGQWALLPDDELTKQLADIGAEEIDPERLRAARRLFAQALETPGGLKIQTIHSFCQHVLARFPVEADIPARFRVLDERDAAELMAEARNDVLALAGHGGGALAQAVTVLATRTDAARFAEILDLAVGGGRGRLRDILAFHGGNEGRLFATLRARLGVAPGVDESDVAARFCTGLQQERAKLVRAAAWLSGGSSTDQGVGGFLTDFIAGGMAPELIDKLRKAFLTDKGESRKSLVTKALAKAEPALLAYLEDLQARFLVFDETRKAAATATLSEALVRVADAVLARYDATKRARAVLDYDDLTLRTLVLLEREDAAAWVLYKLDGGLDHILVDEAQDTSPEQWRIVGKLVEEFFSGAGARDEAKIPRTLFAVGDEKQSIFSFQGARPEEFGRNRVLLQARVTGAGLAFEDAGLEVSRRSARAVLEFIDAVFADEKARDGLTSDGGLLHHKPHRKNVAGYVEVWPPVKPAADAKPDPWGLPVDAPSQGAAYVELARRIAVRVAEWLRMKPVLPATGKPVQPGDIMILVRRRNAFVEEMIRQFMEHGIEVAGADRMMLSEQIAIADLLALGRFALLPDDDLTLAALLKSPLIGFGEDDLFALADGRAGRLWSALAARREENPLFAHAYAVLADALKSADYAAPFEFYARILGRGARRLLVARLGDEAADAIDEFLALALAHESAHPPSLESFLDWFGRGASEIKRDMEQAGKAVRVMTVHGAKGLQAPIVIVPDTAQAPDHARHNGLFYTDDCVFFGVPKALETPPIAAIKAAAHESEMREYRRLLYVALTRAQDWLVVCGYETKHGVHPQSWYPFILSAAQRIGREARDANGETVFAFGEAPAAGREKEAAATASALPGFLRAAPSAERPAPRILRPSQAAGEEEPPVLSPFAGDDTARFRRGLLVHEMLAALPDVAADAREQAALGFLARRGVGEAEAPALAAETLAVLAHPDFAALFGPGSRGEIAIAAELPELGAGVRVSGQIDRLAVTGDCVLVADFKTNRPPPAKVEDTPALYRAQMALYRAALAKIYPGKRIACALVWTDGPRLMHLPDALLDGEIAKITSRLVE